MPPGADNSLARGSGGTAPTRGEERVPKPRGSGGWKGRLWTSRRWQGAGHPAARPQAGTQRAGRAGAQRFIGNTSRGGGGGGVPRAGCGAAVLRQRGPGPPRAYVSVSPLVTYGKRKSLKQGRPEPGLHPAHSPAAHPGLDVFNPPLQRRQFLVQGGQSGPARHVCGKAAVRHRGPHGPARPSPPAAPAPRPHRRS